jgi:hypothetical protein
MSANMISDVYEASVFLEAKETQIWILPPGWKPHQRTKWDQILLPKSTNEREIVVRLRPLDTFMTMNDRFCLKYLDGNDYPFDSQGALVVSLEGEESQNSMGAYDDSQALPSLAEDMEYLPELEGEAAPTVLRQRDPSRWGRVALNGNDCDSTIQSNKLDRIASSDKVYSHDKAADGPSPTGRGFTRKLGCSPSPASKGRSKVFRNGHGRAALGNPVQNADDLMEPDLLKTEIDSPDRTFTSPTFVKPLAPKESFYVSSGIPGRNEEMKNEVPSSSNSVEVLYSVNTSAHTHPYDESAINRSRTGEQYSLGFDMQYGPVNSAIAYEKPLCLIVDHSGMRRCLYKLPRMPQNDGSSDEAAVDGQESTNLQEGMHHAEEHEDVPRADPEAELAPSVAVDLGGVSNHVKETSIAVSEDTAISLNVANARSQVQVPSEVISRNLTPLEEQDEEDSTAHDEEIELVPSGSTPVNHNGLSVFDQSREESPPSTKESANSGTFTGIEEPDKAAKGPAMAMSSSMPASRFGLFDSIPREPAGPPVGPRDQGYYESRSTTEEKSTQTPRSSNEVSASLNPSDQDEKGSESQDGDDTEGRSVDILTGTPSFKGKTYSKKQNKQPSSGKSRKRSLLSKDGDDATIEAKDSTITVEPRKRTTKTSLPAEKKRKTSPEQGSKIPSVDGSPVRPTKSPKGRRPSSRHFSRLDEIGATSVPMMPAKNLRNPGKSSSANRYAGPDPRIVFSSSTTIDSKPNLMRFLKKEGGEKVEDIKGATMLCVGRDELKKTAKLILAITSGKDIVTDSWITDSSKAGHLLDTTSYLPLDEKHEKEWGFNLRNAIRRGKVGHKPLDGFKVYFTPSLKSAGGNDLKEIAVIAGAEWCGSQSKKPSDDFLVILTGVEDKDREILINKGFRTFSKELLTVGILRKELGLDSGDFSIGMDSE